MDNGLEYTFFQKKISDQYTYEQMLNINIREKQIKTTKRYHLLPLRMITIKKKKAKLK